MQQIPLGAKGTSMLEVQPEHLANRFKDVLLPQVLGTHQRIVIELRSFNERLSEKST